MPDVVEDKLAWGAAAAIMEAATTVMTDKFFPEPIELVMATDTLKKAINDLRSKVDSRALDALGSLLSITAGPDLTATILAGLRGPPARPWTAVPYSVIVPVLNPNGHNYTLGEPVMLIPEPEALLGTNQSGRLGNNLPNVTDAIRPATKVEIAAFASTASKEFMGRWFGFLPFLAMAQW